MSCSPIVRDKNGPITSNPNRERKPAPMPIIIEAHGVSIKSAEAPITTPPATVAFKTASILNLPFLKIGPIMKTVKQLPVNDIIVLKMVLCLAFPADIAQLNDGQYIHKNIVPIIPIRLDK